MFSPYLYMFAKVVHISMKICMMYDQKIQIWIQIPDAGFLHTNLMYIDLHWIWLVVWK